MPKSFTLLIKLINRYLVRVLAVPATSNVDVCVEPHTGYVTALSVIVGKV